MNSDREIILKSEEATRQLNDARVKWSKKHGKRLFITIHGFIDRLRGKK